MNPSPGFWNVVISEWTKLRSLRVTWFLAALAIVASSGFAALMSLGFGVTLENEPANDTSAFDPLLSINLGLMFGVVVLKVLAVIAVTSEYSSGMIRSTFIATPRRLRVLAARSGVVAGIGLVLSALMVLSMYAVSQPILGYFGLPASGPGDSAFHRFLLTYGVGGIAYTLVPLSIAFLLRSTAGAITVSIGIYFFPAMLGAAMPLWVQENVLRYLPDVALDSLAGAISSTSPVFLSGGQALLVIAVWMIGLLAFASVTITQRDA